MQCATFTEARLSLRVASKRILRVVRPCIHRNSRLWLLLRFIVAAAADSGDEELVTVAPHALRLRGVYDISVKYEY